MFLCFDCGKRFGVDDFGHVDDHVEICAECHPDFVKRMQNKTDTEVSDD